MKGMVSYFDNRHAQACIRTITDTSIPIHGLRTLYVAYNEHIHMLGDSQRIYSRRVYGIPQKGDDELMTDEDYDDIMGKRLIEAIERIADILEYYVGLQ